MSTYTPTVKRSREKHKAANAARRKLRYAAEATATRARKSDPVQWVRQQLPQLRHRAKARGLVVDLDPALVATPEFCPVLGIRLVYGAGSLINPASASLDRFDNSLGYVTGNVFVISLRANFLKKDATAAEMRAVVRYMEQPI